MRTLQRNYLIHRNTLGINNFLHAEIVVTVSDYVQLVHVTEKTRDYHAWQYLKYRRDGTIILINQMIDIIDKTKIDCGLSGYSIEPTESGSMVYAIHRYPPFRGHLSKSLQRRTWGLICHMHKYLNQKEKIKDQNQNGTSSARNTTRK